jgi:quinol monooxygenase YgiN
MKAATLLKDIADFSKESEQDGVSRYVMLFPLDESIETSLYMLEQYKDQAASDAHLQQPLVQKLLKFFGDEAPLAGAPEIHNLAPTFDVRRPNITEAKPGMIFLFAHIGYATGNLPKGLPILEELIHAAQAIEPQFLGCTACKDEANGTVRVVDMFESDEFYESEHVKSAPIAKFHKETTPLANGDFSVVKLKVMHGFLGR